MTTGLPDTPHSGIVTVAELKAYMGNVTLSVSQNYIAAQTLAGVQQELEAYLNRPIEPVQVREILTCDVRNYLNPSVTPVMKVIKYAPINDFLDGLVVPDEPYVADPLVRDPLIGAEGRVMDHAYPVINSPLIHANGIYLGDYQNYQPGTEFFVEYVGGYDGYSNLGLKQAIMRVAAREMSTNTDKTLNLRDGSGTPANAPDPRLRGWQPDELVVWDRLRRRIAV